MPGYADVVGRSARGGLALVLVLVAGGCGALPQAQRRTTPDAVRARLERMTGIRLNEVPPSPVVANLPNVEATYFGGDIRENLLVLVFNSAKATVQPLGRRFAMPPGTALIRNRNVLVFYTRGTGEPDLRMEIGRALRAS